MANMTAERMSAAVVILWDFRRSRFLLRLDFLQPPRDLREIVSRCALAVCILCSYAISPIV